MRLSINSTDISTIVLVPVLATQFGDNVVALGFWVIVLLSVWGKSLSLMTLIENYRQIPLGVSVFIALIIVSLILNRILDESRVISLENDESILGTYDEVVFKVSKVDKEFHENPLGMLLLTDKRVVFIKIIEDETIFAIPLTKIVEVDNLYSVSSGSARKTRDVYIMFLEDECVKKVTFQLKSKAKSLTFVRDLKASVTPHSSGSTNTKKVAIHID
jgi:hypothetical protein